MPIIASAKQLAAVVGVVNLSIIVRHADNIRFEGLKLATSDQILSETLLASLEA